MFFSLNFRGKRIVFAGSDKFSVPFLRCLVHNNWPVIEVLTFPDKVDQKTKKILTSPVKHEAQKYNLPIFQPESLSTPEVLKHFQEIKPDVFILVAYGKIIPPSLLKNFVFLNVHPSLLPIYRGPSPIETTILNGDRKTGVTIILIDEQVDHGPIVAQKEMEIIDKPYKSELEKQLADLGCALLNEFLPKFFNKEYELKEQKHELATYTRKFTKEDGRINWHDTSCKIERQIRAFEEWPTAWTTWNNLRLKILKAYVLNEKIKCASNPQPGYLWLTTDHKLAINCGEGSLVIEELQIEGKKPLPAQDFLRGRRDFIGSILV